MKTFLWSCAAIFMLVVSVESLSCYTCGTSILGYCAISQQIVCSNAQNSCYTGVVSLTGFTEELHSKGCTEQSSCNNTVTPIFNNNINLTVSMKCCNTSLCNRAGPGLTPLTLGSALTALLLALGMNLSL